MWLKSAWKGGRSLCRWDVFYRAQLYGVAGTAHLATAYDPFNGLKYHLDAAIQNFAPTIMDDQERPYFSHHDAVVRDFYDNLWIAKNATENEVLDTERLSSEVVLCSKYRPEMSDQTFSDLNDSRCRHEKSDNAVVTRHVKLNIKQRTQNEIRQVPCRS